MKPLKYYLSISTKLIKQKCPYLANDDQVIGDIASKLMKAEIGWNGKGNKYGYMISIARFGLMDIIKKHKKRRSCSLSNTETSYIHKEFDVMILHDFIDVALKQKVINNNQYNSIKKYYLYNQTYREIAKDLNVSHEMIRVYISSGIQKLRNFDNGS